MAAPKKLRTLYKRRIRRKGYYYSKSRLVIDNLKNCDQCGKAIHAYSVCVQCFKKNAKQ